MAAKRPGIRPNESIEDWQDRRIDELRSFYNARETKDAAFMVSYADRAIDALGERYGTLYLLFDALALIGKLNQRVEELERRVGDDAVRSKSR